jgi:hypothetical protein
MATLRKWFGPSRREIWQQLSADLHAQFVQGSIGRADRIQATHGAWTVTLDTYVVSNGKTAVTVTRMRAPYVNPDGFRFTIYRRGFFSDLAKRLGMQDVEVGYETFDHDFIIKGTHEAQLKKLFADQRLRDLIARQPDIHLGVKDDEGWFGPTFPDGVDELYFAVNGAITDVERLKLLYELFAETLDQLCRIGSGYEQPPDVAV